MDFYFNDKCFFDVKIPRKQIIYKNYTKRVLLSPKYSIIISVRKEKFFSSRIVLEQFLTK